MDMRDSARAGFQTDIICIPDNASNVVAAVSAVDAFCSITSSTDTLTVPQEHVHLTSTFSLPAFSCSSVLTFNTVVMFRYDASAVTPTQQVYLRSL